MAVEEGYKKTEIGAIPVDWMVSTIGKSFKLINGRAFAPNDWGDRGLPIIRIQNLNDPDSQFNYYNKPVEDKHKIEAGDLLFAWSGTKGTSFGARIWSGPTGVLNQHIFKVIPDLKRFTPAYAYLVLHRVQEEIEKHAHGFKASFVHVKKSDLTEIILPLPPTKAEQEAIAEALSDADGLIESLEQFIAKKRQIKQGAMQELLTGKRRLPGFQGEWTVKTLNDLTDCLDNLRVPLNESQRSRMKGGIPYCGANGILDYVNDWVVDDDIILMAEDGGYFDEYAYRPIAYRMKGKCWVNNHAHILKAKDGYDQGFIYYSLVHKNILDYLASGTRAKLNKSEMNKIEIKISKDETEQTAIASILSDMDAEITELETKLTKARKIKQGMMQELLTGRIRLV